MIFPLLLLLAATSVVYWYSQRRPDNAELRLSGVVEGDQLNLGSKVGGRLKAVLVDEGMAVKTGDLVAQFDIPELEAQREQLLALIDEAGAGLERLKNGPRPQEVASAHAGVKAARANVDELLEGTRKEDIAAAESALQALGAELELAQANLNRAEELYAADVLPRKDLDTAVAGVKALEERKEALRQEYEKALAGPRQQTIDAAQARLEAAQASLSLLQSGSRSEDIDMASARVAFVEAQLRALESQIAESSVFAPADGTVLTRNFEPGDLVPAGGPVVTLILSGTYYVQTFIPEGLLSWAVPGTAVQIEVDSLPGASLTGTVEFLSVAGEFTPRNLQTEEDRVEQVFRCKVVVPDAGGQLRPGMACDLVFSPPAGQAP